VTEKSLETSSSSTRTSILYDAVVSVENSNGRLSAGVGAVVSLDTEDTSETKTDGQESEEISDHE
jgi:hypothetical protein